LSSTLDESADRIVMLEKEAREQDSIVSQSHLFNPILYPYYELKEAREQDSIVSDPSYLPVFDTEY
jgi:hypothetical protein